MGFPFHKKDKFDVEVTIEEGWTRQLSEFEERWSVLFPIPSFKQLLDRHFGVNLHEYISSLALGF